MRDENVHRLFLNQCTASAANVPSHREPEQLELFDHTFGSIRAISYLDIAVLDQDLLLRSLIMNAVTTVIDLRGVPVFPKPRFDHRFLMSYFYERSVNYIEFAMIKKSREESARECESLSRWFTMMPSNGMTACIIDHDAIRGGAVASFRKSMASMVSGYIEIHPRALG